MTNGNLTRRRLLSVAASGLATPALARFPHEVPPGLIFFVGNSFTRQHDIPAQVCSIARQSGVDAHCHRHTNNGARLGWSLDFARSISRDRGGPLPGPVVLQDHSIEPLTAYGRQRSAEAMAVYSAQFGRTVLFETWPRRAGHALYRHPEMPSGPVEMATIVRRHYAEQARRLGAAHAPVAGAWISATDAGIDLFARDGYHANPEGAWLCAMLLARALGIPEPFAATPPPTVDRQSARSLAAIAAATS
ncbi:MAG: hypothetical protein AAF334_05620 [Pseudomonadota bacterium]